MSEDEIAAMDDAALLAAWHATAGEVGDPLADALIAEIQRRELDF